MRDSKWGNLEWLQTEAGASIRALIRDGKGWEALQVAHQAGFTIDNSLVSDALDTTSMSLSFARAKGDEQRIKDLEQELKLIKDTWGNPHSS